MTDNLPPHITPGTLGVVTTRDRIDEEDGGAIVGSFAPGNKNRGQPFFAVGETVILVGRPKPDPSKVIVAHMFGWVVLPEANVRLKVEEGR